MAEGEGEGEAEGQPQGEGKAVEGETTTPPKVKPKVERKVGRQGEARVAYLCPRDGKAFPDAASMQGHVLRAHLRTVRDAAEAARGDTPSKDTTLIAAERGCFINRSFQHGVERREGEDRRKHLRKWSAVSILTQT